jgi:hypothetical protein
VAASLVIAAYARQRHAEVGPGTTAGAEELASYHLNPDVLDAAAAMASDQRSDSPRASTRRGRTISYGPAPCVCSRTPLSSLRNEISRDRHSSEKVSTQPAPSMFTRHPHSRQVNRTELEHC